MGLFEVAVKVSECVSLGVDFVVAARSAECADGIAALHTVTQVYNSIIKAVHRRAARGWGLVNAGC